jgi:hypothetical protein
LTAGGQRVGLVTRAAADQADSTAAHRPPPFPTVLALDLRLLADFLDLFPGSESGRQDRLFQWHVRLFDEWINGIDLRR